MKSQDLVRRALLSAATLFALTLAGPAAAQDRPNILVIWGDDIGYWNISAYNQGLAGSNAKIVFLTVHDDPDFVREALAAGALGYVVKPRLASDLPMAVREAIAGRSFVSPTVAVDDAG